MFATGRFGAVAQLGEHRVCNAEVEGSNPFRSTFFDLQATFPTRPGRSHSLWGPYEGWAIKQLVALETVWCMIDRSDTTRA